MNGIYVEKSKTEDIWTVKDAKTGEVVSFGASVVSAVENYEVAKAYKDLEQEYGIDSDSF